MYDMLFRSTFIAEQNDSKHDFLVFSQNEKLITIEASWVKLITKQVSVVITLLNGFLVECDFLHTMIY